MGLLLGDRAAPARVAAVVSMIGGVVSLTGWAFQLQSLTTAIPGADAMKANTGLSVVLCGFALLILVDGASVGMEKLAQVLSIAVMILGSATLAEYYFARDFGIDELLVGDSARGHAVFRGRMAPFSALALIAIAAALAAKPHQRLHAVTRWGAVFGLAVGVTSLLGYLWGAAEIVTDRWLPPVALNSAACFALLGGGILLSPDGSSAGSDANVTALAAVEIKILAGFIVAMSLLLVGGSYTYRTNVQFADSVGRVAHTQEVRASLASLYGSLAGAEVALRDFLLTPDALHRDEYQRLVEDVQVHLGNVDRLTADNPVQQRNLAALEPLVTGRLAALNGVLRANQEFGLLAARAVLAQSRKTNSTVHVRESTDRMDSVEERLLAERQLATTKERRTTLISLLVTMAVAAGLFTALFRAIHREMRGRRNAENALRASEQYNRSIVDSSPDCLGVLTLQGRLTQMTPQGCRLMEVEDFSAIADIDWLTIWKEPDRTAAAAAVEAALRGKDGRFQGYCATQKGNPKWWDVIVMPVLGAGGRPERLLAVARDISDVKRGESDLREANRFLDSLIENLPVMVVLKDAATLSFVRLNRAFERFLGYSRDESLGKNAHDLFSAEEAEFIDSTDREALALGGLVDIAEQQIHTDSLGVRAFHTMKMPIGDHAGKPQFLLAISVDITERKLAEHAIRELNSALEAKAEQLTAINKDLESFSYSVSHDLRAPLRAIDGFALMIEEDYNERLDAEGRRYLAVIRDNSKRMGALIDDLLAFSRLGRLPIVPNEINVESLVREVVEEALNGHDEAPPRFEIGKLPPAQGDRVLLRQVWTNLISNAIKYSGKSSEPRIEVSGQQNASENLYSIRDNGVGFNMDYVDKLFGVFQRLHRADEFTGTGVGLAIVHRAVTRHGGRVWAEGNVNAGAVFSFTLPNRVSNA
ncbi:MAG TPA: PAS domain-containing protein [Steroidobacteraceae bacterium]|nr:PAS domain-containing protein [Steroidobacteraceae bacterium]